MSVHYLYITSVLQKLVLFIENFDDDSNYVSNLTVSLAELFILFSLIVITFQNIRTIVV